MNQIYLDMQLVYIGFYSLEVEENRSTCLVFVSTCTITSLPQVLSRRVFVCQLSVASETGQTEVNSVILVKVASLTAR